MVHMFSSMGSAGKFNALRPNRKEEKLVGVYKDYLPGSFVCVYKGILLEEGRHSFVQPHLCGVPVWIKMPVIS